MDKRLISESLEEYYDLLYSGRGYSEEASLIEALAARYLPYRIRKILDLGCGTGGHMAQLVSRGYDVTGVDISEKFVNMGRVKVPQANIITGDIRSFHTTETFDFVACMFGVMNYQLETKDVLGVMHSANRALIDSGLFVFDFWNGLAVLNTKRPNGVLKEITTNDGPIFRYSEIVHDNTFSNVTELKITIMDLRERNFHPKIIKDTQRQRFFFLHEMMDYLTQTGFEILEVTAANVGTTAVNKESPLNLRVVARKKEARGWR